MTKIGVIWSNGEEISARPSPGSPPPTRGTLGDTVP